MTYVLVLGEIVPGLLGNDIKVLVKELAGGNYSCHLGQNGEYLNHTVILVQLDPENKTVILEENPSGKGKIRQMEYGSKEKNI